MYFRDTVSSLEPVYDFALPLTTRTRNETSKGSDAEVAPLHFTSSTRKGRRPMFVPSTVDKADYDAGIGYISRHIVEDRVRHRAIAVFDEFLRKNPTFTTTTAIIPFLGQMQRSGLSDGTMREYMKHVATAYPSPDSRKAHKACIRAYADAETSHALDVRRQVLLDLPSRAEGVLRAAIFLLTNTGSTLADLQRLRRTQVVFAHGRTLVQWRLTKRKTKRRQRREVAYPDKWGIDPKPLFIDRFWSDSIEQRPLASVTVAQVNAFVRSNCDSTGGRFPTTYTFRRSFINHVLRQLDGDLDKCLQYSGHCSKDMILAHYQYTHAEEELILDADPDEADWAGASSTSETDESSTPPSSEED